MEKLTMKQQQIYEFIRSYIKKYNYPPSLREICEAVGLLSTSSVHNHLKSLERKHYIKRNPSKNRSIEIIEKSDFFHIPLIGIVAAGDPMIAIENVEDHYPIPSSFMQDADECFLLKIKGNSMINAGIHDRDLVIVRKQNYAKNGDIVLALLNDSATVKRFYKENGHFRLQPENDCMCPIFVDHLSILGIITGLYRQFV